ncbi:MAG: serine protease, partial [Saprospiraceae bacterium]|nr:serine protease [Saprospiraceae bacterium]
MRSNTNFFRLLLWIVLLGAGFLAGVAWKSNDTRVDQPAAASEESNATLVREQQETPSADPAAARTDLTAEERATINLFEKASRSVAFITTTNVRMDFFTRNVTEIPRGTGSGFVWDQKGHIVTN